MGGGASRFEETDWSTASGGRWRLAADEDNHCSRHSSCATAAAAAAATTMTTTTADGSPPTPRFEVYTLTKCGHSWAICPREFDVSDDRTGTLLYSTMALPVADASIATLAAAVSSVASSFSSLSDSLHQYNPLQQQRERQEQPQPSGGGGSRIGAGVLGSFDVYLGRDAILVGDSQKRRRKGDDANGATTPPPPYPLLRVVPVDWKKLRWIVYRCNRPCFPGQSPDGSAIIAPPSRAVSSESALSESSPFLLYRSYGIAVSWSRCWAAAVPYGPPPSRTAYGATDHEGASSSHSTITVHGDSGNDDDDPSPVQVQREEDDRQLLRGHLQWGDESPLLVCQEVSNRIMGSHQTFLADAQMVREQWRRSGSGNDNDDDLGGSSSSNANDSTRVSLDESTSSGSASASTRLGDPANDDNQNRDKSSSSGLANEMEGTTTNQPPLVGYWAWQPSLRSHHLKMHLAKDSDLALHVVLAVIMNQVRSERNALAFAL